MSIRLHHSILTQAEQQWFGTPEAIQSLISEAHFITGGPYNRIWRWESPAGQCYYIKIYHARGHHLRNYCVKSRAKGEWESLLYFQRNNLNTSELLVYGESSLYHKAYEGGFLVQREVTETQDLRQLAEKNPRWQEDKPWRRKVLFNVADTLRKLHQTRFVHRDFKWRNILVKLDNSTAVYLIDCPLGRRRLSPFYHLGWWRDLRSFDKTARRFLSRTERLRVYLAYRQQTSLASQDKKLIAKLMEN